MKVLVTGGTGFIGRWTVRELIARGHTPIVLDHHDRAEPLDEPCEVFYGDVRDDVAVTEAMAHAEAFIHLAAVLGTQETIDNPRPAAQSNLMGGLNILEAAAQYGIPGTYIGVGNHWMNNTYSITKTMIERFVDMFNRNRGTRVNIVRAMNAYGPGQVAAAPYGPAKVRKITPSFVCRALAGDPIEVYGDGQQISDMVWVGDVAKALVGATLLAAKEPALIGKTYNRTFEIGPKIHNTVLEVAEIVNEICGNKSQIHHLPMRPGEIPGATVVATTSSDEMREIGIDTDELMPLWDGLRETVEYFRGIMLP